MKLKGNLLGSANPREVKAEEKEIGERVGEPKPVPPAPAEGAKDKKEKQKLISSLILLLLAVAIGFFLLKPAYSQVKNLRAEIRIKEESLTAKQKLFEDIKRLETKLEEIKEETKRVFYALPTEADIAGLLVQLETIASQNGMIFESVNFTKEEPVEEAPSRGRRTRVALPAYKTLMIYVETTGTYNALENYLKAVESNIRLTNIGDITFSPAQATGGVELPVSTYSFSLRMEAYYKE